MIEVRYCKKTRSMYIKNFYKWTVIEDTEPCETINGVFFDKDEYNNIVGIEIVDADIKIYEDLENGR